MAEKGHLVFQTANISLWEIIETTAKTVDTSVLDLFQGISLWGGPLEFGLTGISALFPNGKELGIRSNNFIS